MKFIFEIQISSSTAITNDCRKQNVMNCRKLIVENIRIERSDIQEDDYRDENIKSHINSNP